MGIKLKGRTETLHFPIQYNVNYWGIMHPDAMDTVCHSGDALDFKHYGSLYVTLCFVLWRFDFGVLTFYFHILSFLFCVLCTMLFILNGAIHEVKTRYRRKDGRK